MMDPQERERIFEKAGEVGRLISQTPEYAYLKTAHAEISEDKEAASRLDTIRSLQEQLLGYLDRNEEPPEELRQELGDLSQEMQASSRYQSLISSQANFDKLMERVNQAIGRGIKAGEESKIILP
jgi:cell fate (sporulation/competence/biofilm development) regulator YlbF (YheA/YmcA/DUF963 family)